MEQKNTDKVKLVAIKYNDYARDSRAKNSIPDGIVGLREAFSPSLQSDYWLIFSGTPANYSPGFSTSHLEEEEFNKGHSSRVREAFKGGKIDGLNIATVDAIMEKDGGERVLIDSSNSAKPRYAMASIVEHSDPAALFPNADIQEVSKFKDPSAACKGLAAELGKGPDADAHERVTSRINTSGAGQGCDR